MSCLMRLCVASNESYQDFRGSCAFAHPIRAPTARQAPCSHCRIRRMVHSIPTRAQLVLTFVGLLAALTAAGFAQGTKLADSGWQSLFDGKALGSWQPSKFGGDGTVRVENS